MIGIYKITSPSNRVYIGQSLNINIRFKTYKRLSCKRQPKLYNSILKYGIENHKFEIICECLESEMNDKERYYQDLYSANGVKGLNCSLTKSSDRSGRLSIETRKKIAEKSKITSLGRKFSDESKLKMSLSRKGFKHSEETKVIMSLAGKGKIRSEQHSKNISLSKKGTQATLGQKRSDDFKNRCRLINLGKKISDETKLKMSIAGKKRKHSEESRKKMCLSQKGHSVSEQTKLNISKANKGKKRTEEQLLKKQKIILNIETGIYYYGIQSASDSINMDKNNLASRFRGVVKNNTPLICV